MVVVVVVAVVFVPMEPEGTVVTVGTAEGAVVAVSMADAAAGPEELCFIISHHQHSALN